MANRRNPITTFLVNLASNLLGKNINGWVVEEKIEKVGGTGGNFSSGYKVRDEAGRPAFMKAFNIGYALSGMPGSIADKVQEMTEGYKHERDLIQMCGAKHLDRVVVGLDHGEYREGPTLDFVPYIVFELADQGDLRRHPRLKGNDLGWRLRVFHGVCVGVMQLHAENVVHQDLKPSNVMLFGGENSKIGDLGRATDGVSKRNTGPGHWGDPGYRPIEFTYAPDWNGPRRTCDLYMLGGILAFLIANVSILGLVLSKTPTAYHPKNWKGTFADALPALRHATLESVGEIVATVPGSVQNDIKDLLLWLCEPDPMRRGHPASMPVVNAAGIRSFSLERVVSIADRVANRLRIEAK